MHATKSAKAFTPSIIPDVPFGIAQPNQMKGLSGLDAARAIPRGDLPTPSMAQTLQQWILLAAKGKVEFRGTPMQAYLNPMDLVHGGWSVALLDSAMGCAVQAVLEAGEFYTSLATEVKFLRPAMMEMEQVRAICTVIDRTRQTASAEARIEDMQRRILATGTSTCFLKSLGQKPETKK
ncbi:MAG: PaaI family thioesterase [Paracoccaceae bacterium]|uniref:PaaI family thioesterase n=1 Tax=Shimia thalassica TaxID=1715693 RepID=UPI00329A54B1